MKPRRIFSAARLSLPFASALAALLSLSSASADALNWTGANNGSWNTGTNWSGSSVPLITDDLTILGPLNVAGALTIDFDADNFAKSLIFTNTAATSITNTTSGADKTLTLGSGGITTGAGAVQIGSTTTNQAVNITLGAAQTWNIGAGGMTFSNLIGGAGTGLTKTGTGNLTLNSAAVSTFTGGLNVNAGTLVLDYTNLATPTDLIDSGNALTLGGGALTITGKNVAAATTSQTFASTTLGVGRNTINIAKGAAATSATLNLGALTANAGSVTVFSPTTAWTNTASTTERVFISAGGSVPALPGAGTTAFVNAGVFHRVTGGANGTLRLAAVNEFGQLSLKANGGNLAASTAIDPTNTYQFSAAGAGIALSNTASIYGLLLNSTSAFNAITIANSGTLTLNSIIQIKATETVNINAGTGISNLVIGSERNLVIAVDHTAGVIINAPIVNNGGGASTVTIAGTAPTGTPGGVTFNGANTFTGNVVVNRGTLGLGGTNNFTDIAVNGATLISGGTSVGPGTLGAAGGTITFTGTSSFTPQRTNTAAYNKNVDISSGTTTFGMSTQFFHETFSGVFSGAGTLVKNDSNGILTFSNSANTFTGAIRLDGGTGGLVVNSLLDSANAITFNGNTGALSLGAGTASSLLFNSRQIVLAHTNGGEITNNNGSASNTITINTNLGFSGTGTRLLELGGSNFGLNTFDGNITNNTNGGAATSVTKSGTGRWLISGDMSHTGGISFGGGTLVLSGTNTYSGATNFTAAGIQLIFAGTQAVSPNTTYVMNTNASTSNSSVKLLDDTGGVNNTLVTATGSTFRIQNSNGPGNNHDFIVGNNNTANGGTSSGTTTGSTIAIGTLDWGTYASGTTAYGPINIQGTNGYRLQINSVVLHNAANLASNVVGQTTFSPTTANVTMGTVTVGTGNVNLGIQTFVMDGTSSDNRVTGAISNASDFGTSNRALRVTKSNTSTWTLGGTNTYTGPTSVTGGLLRFTGDSSAATGAVAVSGGALGGNGGSLGGAVTVSSTGGINLADGSVGNLTLGSTLNITGAAGANNLRFDLGNTTGTSDSLVVAGATTVTTTGAAVINLAQLGGSAGRTETTYSLIGGAGTLDATNFAKFSLATTKAFGQTYALANTGDALQVVATNVTSTVGNVTLSGTNPSWLTGSNFTGDSVPDFGSNVTINSNIGTTGSLGASTNINSLTYGTSATTGTTVTPGTAAAGTPFNMLVIEADTTNDNTSGNGITLSNTSGTHTISANIGLAASQTWTVAGTTGGLTVSGVISDFGLGNSLTKAGGGTLTISATPTYTGSTTISGGTLNFSSAPASFNTSSIIFSGNSTLLTGGPATQALPNMTVNSGVTATLNGGGGGSNSAYSMSALTSGSSTSKFVLTSSGGSGRGITFGSLAGFTGTLEYNITTGGGFFITTPDLADTAGTFIRMSTPNTSATALAFNYNGSSNLTLDNRQFELFGTTANTTYNINNNGTGTFTINPSLLVSATGSKILALGGTNAGSNSFAGSIADGTGAVISVTKTGAGSWALGNTGNTFTGAITVNAGTLAYASAGGANGITFTNTTGAATLTYTGAAKEMSGAISASTVTTGTVNLISSGAGAVNYSNTANITTAATGIRNLVLAGTNTGDNTLAGGWVNNANNNAATLTKNDAGTWILASATNTYTGATNVNAGKLLVNGTTSTSAFAVAHGATLGGTGTIGGTVSVANGATLSPGASIESLRTGALTMLSGSTFAYEASNNSATGADLLGVNGALTLTGVNLSFDLATIAALSNASWTEGNKLTLISYDGTAITSGFNGYANDTNYNFGANVWTFKYNDTGVTGGNFGSDLIGSNFVTLTAFTVIPEPSTALLSALGVLALFRRRRN